MISSVLFRQLVNQWAKADQSKVFNFTSGHLGALPIKDTKLIALVQSGDLYQAINLGALLALELVKFIVLTILPIKNLSLVLRTVFRRFFGKKTDFIHALTVISLGNQPSEKDPYFGLLLINLDEKFNYLKIVGGFDFKSKNYEFIESALSYANLFKLAFSILFSPLFALCYLLSRALTLNSCKNFTVFTILGLKEINSGIFSNNKIIVTSIRSWLANNQTKKILYPMEGRNWEKNIVETMKAKGIYSIGYLHCALTPRHLSLTQTGFYRLHDIPSVIIANSEMSAKLLSQTFPKALVREGFFLRGSANDRKDILQDSNTLLFALTGSIEESSEILNCLAESRIQTIYKVIIRLNPNTSSYAYLAAFAEKFKFNLYTGNETSLPSICFFRSSSVALDYLKFNVLPVYISTNEVVTNNVFELDNKYKFNSLVFTGGNGKAGDIAANIKKIVDDKLDCSLNGAEISNYYLSNYQSFDSFAGLLD